MVAQIPPKVRLVDSTGQPTDANTLPAVGPKTADSALPVVLAKGLDPVQKYVPVAKSIITDNAAFALTVATVVNVNPDRRYLRIINNGAFDVELWTGVFPVKENVGQVIARGEVVFAKGYGLAESDTCRTSAIYATSAGGATGLLVLEG